MSRRVEGDIIIMRPVDEVFDVCADERNEPRYNPRMTHAEQTSSGANRSGLAVPRGDEDDGAKGGHDRRVDSLRSTSAPRVLDTPVRHGYPR